jgi:hypothetical protein
MISKAQAKQFWLALEENETCMGEMAALEVTLQQFGLDHEDLSALAEAVGTSEEGSQCGINA